jgi:ribonuclease R
MRAVDGTFVGVLSRRGRFAIAEPLFERGRRVTVELPRRSEIAFGDLVLVRDSRGGGRGEVVRSLGRPEIAHDVVEALFAEHGYVRWFDESVEKEAAQAAGAEDPHRRRDLTELPTFTIDPAQARDFDDAISSEATADGMVVYVHIADVAAHVRPGSALDAEAYRRGNSVYVPGAVEPMLPEALSNQACSLVPGEVRKAVTVEIALDAEGAVRSASFHRSLIRSDARFSYEQVDHVFAGRETAPEPVTNPLALARQAAARLRERRFARGALTIESSEPEFEFDERGNVVRAIDDVQTESHAVIEELMILANEQVAGELERRRLPTLYRVHEQPEPTAIEQLVRQLESLDVPTPPIPEHMTPRVAGEVAGAIAARVAEHVSRTGRGQEALTSLVLRSLKQAVYSHQNIGHAGLASPTYTHFTSPIRRYPDLVVHRALLAAIGAGEDPPTAHSLPETARHCSETERAATELEHKADDICLAFLLEHDLYTNGWDREFEGEVTGLVGGGLFVRFAITDDEKAAACEGFVPTRRLGEWFELNEQGTAIVGSRTGKTVRLADPIPVTVDRVEPQRGRVDLAPPGAREKPRGPRTPAGAGRGRRT